MEDRSALFNQLKDFSQRKLKKVETKVVTGTGELLVEKRGAKGLQVLTGGGQTGDGGAGQEPARKLDLQVGFILPGLLFGSEDVAQDKSSLESYGITHILNLDRDVSNKYEDDYNYKTVAIQDKPDFELDKVLDECFDFIDDGRHYGNVFIHCSGTIGLSRSTSICIAYLMNKEKQAFQEAFNNVKEARAFVKPNEGFVKQLKDYEVKLRGAQAVKESGIDDPFALRKKQEIEQEKAMVAGAASVKNRMKMFGANLDTSSAAASGPPSGRSKSASPSPYKQQPAPSGPTSNQNSATSKWSSNQNASSSTTSTSSSAADKLGSKSMTPEPRKSWQQQHQPGGPPPPPPPMPTSSLLSNDKSSKPITTTKISSSNKSSLPPPPPPPPSSFASSKANESSHQDKPAASSIKSRYQPTTTNTTTTKTTQSGQRKGSVASETSEDETGSGQRVFGRRPPPPMKIRGGLSIERHDSTSSDKPDERAKGRSTQPMTAQIRLDTGNCESRNQQPFSQRCPSPLVLMNNVSTGAQSKERPLDSSLTSSTSTTLQHRRGSKGNEAGGGDDESGVQSQLSENPFTYWQRTLSNRGAGGGSSQAQQEDSLAAPKRTVSLGPKRSRQIGAGLQNNPFLSGANKPAADSGLDRAAAVERRGSFSKAARELQSSLTELNKLIDSSPSPIGSSATLGRRPRANWPPLAPAQQATAGASSDRPATAAIVHGNRAPLLVYNEIPPTPSSASVQSIRGQTSRRLVVESNDEQQENKEEQQQQRFMWQEDLANWKSSNSVNDLLSVFESAKGSSSPSSPRGAGADLPPAASPTPRTTRLGSTTTSVLKRIGAPWQQETANSNGSPLSAQQQQQQQQNSPNADYTIRRTTSTSSSLKTRPVLRNPYRTTEHS